MQQKLRAGLIGIILAFLLILTAAAPITRHKTSSLAIASLNASPNLPVPPLPVADIILGDSQNRVTSAEKTNVSVPRELDVLYRRNIFKKIGHAFKSSMSFSFLLLKNIDTYTAQQLGGKSAGLSKVTSAA